MASRTLATSFKVAWNGIRYAITTQRNFRIHAAVGVSVIGLSALIGLNQVEWAVILIMIALVVSAELINTSVEVIVDRLSREHHEAAGIIKDLAAAAVLISCFMAVLVGCCVILPHLVKA